VLDITTLVLRDEVSDNASGADNQQERLSVDAIHDGENPQRLYAELFRRNLKG